ncbi:AzlC family ABC transporter permease [Burkholderia gladioli]|uniref:AzlC family ABC transporter permease n=1 Tax=Burkholderia gladioli TaxID=28095 RepID=UPI001FCA17D7|nr:AzlC family ABC transporter permease [Burkholderia gladioli]
MKDAAWRDVFRLTLPVGMGYLPTGFAFGVLAVQAGLSQTISIGMSVFVFAGALQFAAVPMLAGGSGIAAVALTTLLVNLRHILYAIPLIDHLPRKMLPKAYVIAALTDENYSVLATTPDKAKSALMLKISLVNHVYWIAGTALGAILGSRIAHWIPNLDFALPALFTILAIEQYLSRRNWLPIALGPVAYCVARMAFPDYALISALALGLGALLSIGAVQKNTVEKPF